MADIESATHEEPHTDDGHSRGARRRAARAASPLRLKWNGNPAGPVNLLEHTDIELDANGAVILDQPGLDQPASIHPPAAEEPADSRGEAADNTAFERGQVRRISQSTLARAGDIVAPLSGPLAAAYISRSLGLFLAVAAIVMVVRSHARNLALDDTALELIAPVTATASVFMISAADALVTNDPHTNVLGATLVAALVSGACAIAVRVATRRYGHTKIAVIGSAKQARALAHDLKAENVKNYSVIGFIEQTSLRPVEHDAAEKRDGSRHLGGLDSLAEIVSENDVDLLVLPQGGDRLAVFEQVAKCAENSTTRLVSLGAFNEYVFQRVPINELNAAWLQHIMHPHYRPAPVMVIRALDILGALFLALITLPLWVVAAVWIRLEDGSPILYRQVRTGARGKPFTMIKFRSMRTDAEADGARWSSGIEDDRITRVGRHLRRFHIDELPQLINVLRGDMSLVGPRPERPEFVARLEQDIPFYGRRHLVKPGVTGWAQVRAGYGMTDEGQSVKLSQDLFYLKHQSVLLYVYVLLATCFTVVAGTVHSRAH